MSDYIFIDEHAKVYKGQDALARLQRKNDLVFLEPEGVLKVPRWRWGEAQHYQYNQQMVLGVNKTQDRNRLHRDNFDGYKALNGLEFDRAIEIGCGPFTNIRFISGIKELVLLDPLIEDYSNHPHSQLSKMDVAQLVPSAIEDARNLGQFDLVVMVNVLQHCWNARLVLDRAECAVRRSGYIVFAEEYYPGVRKMLRVRYDAGHPIRPTFEFLEAFCKKFTHVYRKHHANIIYFIGKK